MAQSSNPYDQFGPSPVAQQAQPQAPAAPAAEATTPQQPTNPYADIPEEPAAIQPTAMPMDQFKTELYNRLNDPKGGDLKSIMAWSESVGHKIVPNEDLSKTWQMAEHNRQNPDHRTSLPDVNENAANGGQIDASDIGAFFRGAGNIGTFGFGDEGVAALKALAGAGQGKTIGERYLNNEALNTAQDNVDEVVSPLSRGAGELAGIALSSLVPVGAVKEGAGLGVNMLRGGGIGALEGAIAGTGAGHPGDRFGRTAQGGVFGLLAGAGAPLVARGVSAVAAPALDIVASRTGKGGAINALARRLGVTPRRMSAKAAELRQAGIEPTVYDVIGETGQDMAGALGRRQTAARETMQNFGDEARVGLQDRVRRQASRISNDARTPDEAVADVTAARNSAFEQGIAPLRPRAVPLTADNPAWEVLQTGEGRNAVRAAASLERDPEVKRALLKLGQPVKEPEGAKEIRAMHEQIDAMNLAPEAAAAAKAQLPPIPEAELPTMTLDMADKIARSFNGAASRAGKAGDIGRANVLRDYGREIRGAAADAHPEYRKLLDQYGDESRLADAARLGEQGLDRNTDEFVAKASNLRDDRTPIPTVGKLENIKQTDAGGDRWAFADYHAKDGSKVGLSINFGDDGTAHISIDGKDGSSWEDVKNTLGPAGVRDMMRTLQAQFPEIKAVSGVRTTGASAGGAASKNITLPDVPTDASERDLARLGYRRAIERKAGEGPGGALTIAESLGRAPEQQARAAALLGPEEANMLGRNMAAEVDVARSRIRNAPRTGSRTQINTSDEDFVEGLAADVARYGTVRGAVIAGLKRLGKAGISDKAAERIVNLVTDKTPGAVDQAIEQLTKALSGNRRRAGRLVNLIRNAAILPQGDQSHPE